jgi:hypothetical protein
MAAFVATEPELDLDRLVTVTLRPGDRRAGSAHLGTVSFRAHNDGDGGRP